MSTARQFAANRENAKKSTGPVTPEGKARSSQSHFSHGFTASTSFIRGDESPEDFCALLHDLMREYHPATTTEQILVEKMFHNQVLSLRAIRLQTARLCSLEPGQELPKDLALLIRYQHASDRAFHKAHAELLKAQKERKMSEIGFESKKSDKAPEIPAEPPQNPPRQTIIPAPAPLVEPAIAPAIVPAVRTFTAGGAELSRAA